MIDHYSVRPENPLIVQNDHTLLLEVHHARYEQARAAIGRFAELEKSPEHIHTYRLTPLSLWNAVASGITSEQIMTVLTQFAKYPVPQNVLVNVHDLAGRWGRVKLLKQGEELVVETDDPALLIEFSRNRAVSRFLGMQQTSRRITVPSHYRGGLKQALTAIGWPVEDLAGYVEGLPLSIDLCVDRFCLRDYQAAAAAFYREGAKYGGSGVIVLPCGAIV